MLIFLSNSTLYAQALLQTNLTPDEAVDQIYSYNHSETFYEQIQEVADLERLDGMDGLPRFQDVLDALDRYDLPLLWLENRLMPMGSYRNFAFVIHRNNTEFPKQKINGYNELKLNRYVAGIVPIEELWPVLIQDRITFYEILTLDRTTAKAALDLLTEFQDFIEWHNSIHPEEKVEIGLDWQLVQKKYHYADYISLFEGGVNWNLVFKRETAVQSQMRIKNVDEFKDLLAHHNADPTKDPIHSKMDYVAIHAKYLYPHIVTLERNLNTIDWDDVLERKMPAPGEITISSDAEFENLILQHNIDHPEYKIRSELEYRLRFERYNYPHPDTEIHEILSLFDWKRVYVKPKGKPVLVEIRTHDELQKTMDAHNADPKKPKIRSSEDYKIIGPDYGYTSYATLIRRLGEIDWDKILRRSIVQQSEITLETQEDLKKLIEKHNLDFPNDPIHCGNDFIRKYRDYRYPGTGQLKKLGEIDWNYIFGRPSPTPTDVAESKNRRQLAADSIIESLNAGTIGELVKATQFSNDPRYYIDLEMKIRMELTIALLDTLQTHTQLTDSDVAQLIGNFSKKLGEFEPYFTKLFLSLSLNTKRAPLKNGTTLNLFEFVLDSIRNTLSTFVIQSQIPADRYEIKKHRINKTSTLIKADQTAILLEGTKVRLLEVLKLTTRR